MHRSLLSHARKTAMPMMLVAPLILGFSQTLSQMESARFPTPATTTVNAGVSAGQAT